MFPPPYAFADSGFDLIAWTNQGRAGGLGKGPRSIYSLHIP